MNLEDFDKPQQQALLDLVILAMYADGHLALNEDARIDRLLTGMGFDTKHDRQREFDSSVTRVRKHSQNADTARAHATELARHFTSPEQKRLVYVMLDDMTNSDNQVSPVECRLLGSIKEVFKI